MHKSFFTASCSICALLMSASTGCSEAASDNTAADTNAGTPSTSPIASGGSSGSGGVAMTGGSAGSSGGSPAQPNTGGSSSGSGGALAGDGGTAGAAQMGEAGAAGGGSAGAAGVEDGDTPPWREMLITAPPDNYQHTFRPSDADPMAENQDGTQYAGVDTTKPLLKKLVVDLGGAGGAYLPWFPARGFHFLAVDFMGVGEVPNVIGVSEDFYGDVRLEALIGEDHTDQIDVSYSDSVVGHVTEGLKYLHMLYSEEDWGYYLNEDNTVRWSDVIMTGLSHGASSVARFAKVQRLSRVVSLSGPRDNTCGMDPECGDGIVATWFQEEYVTPVDRMFGITGTGDDQYPEIVYAMEALGYLGELINAEEGAPPYGDSHKLAVNGDHARFCGEAAKWDAVCNYAFGVPPENQ